MSGRPSERPVGYWHIREDWLSAADGPGLYFPTTWRSPITEREFSDGLQTFVAPPRVVPAITLSYSAGRTVSGPTAIRYLTETGLDALAKK